MPIRFSCPCGRRFKTRDGTGGRHARCASCQSLLRVPEDGMSTYQTVAEMYLSNGEPEERPAVPWRIVVVAGKVLLVGGVLLAVLFLGVAVLNWLRAPADQPVPGAENAQAAATRSASNSPEARKFAAQFLDKKVGRTLPDIVRRAAEEGMSSDTAYSLIFDAVSAGLVVTEREAPGKPLLYRLK